MDHTCVTYTNGTKEILPGIQFLSKTKDVATYTYMNLSELEIKKIRDAKAEEVQKILSELF